MHLTPGNFADFFNHKASESIFCLDLNLRGNRFSLFT